jgi:hypothetical protein
MADPLSVGFYPVTHQNYDIINYSSPSKNRSRSDSYRSATMARDSVFTTKTTTAAEKQGKAGTSGGGGTKIRFESQPATECGGVGAENEPNCNKGSWVEGIYERWFQR